MKFQYKPEYQYLTSCMLNVTDACNLACRYCFVEQHPHYMTLDIAKQVVDWLYSNLQKKIEIYPNTEKICQITFFGGEPTLCFDSIIIPLVYYCNQKYPFIFHFSITTNGTLLNKERIDFLKKYNFSILLSIDGNEITQNYNRPCQNKELNSFKMIEKNIPYLLECFPDLCFRSTLYPPTIKYLYENYLYVESLGFKNFEMIADNRIKWNSKNKKILKNEFSKIFLHRLAQIKNNILPLNVGRINLYTAIIIKLLFEDTRKILNFDQETIYRCGLATTNGAIGWDGSIYGCQEQVSKNNKNIFYIGNLLTGGIDKDKHIKLLKQYYNDQNNLILPKKCKNCQMNKICGINAISCPSTTFDLYKNMNTISDINCYLRQLYYKNILITTKLLLNNDTFKKYLKNILERDDSL